MANYGTKTYHKYGSKSSSFRNEDREMFEANCTNCGKHCEVPFKPTGSKPVLCSDCFRRDDDRGGYSDRRPSFRGGPRGGGSNSNIEDMLKKINNKLDKILESIGD